MSPSGAVVRYEYKVVPAPKKTKTFKGVRSHEDQFACVIAETMNIMAAEDWEYLRAESLPCEEKTGLTSRVESYQSVLVFRRKIVNGEKFFDTLPKKQLEHHEIKEDKTEHEVVFPAANRAAAVVQPENDMTETEERAGPAGVLNILQTRKARQALTTGEGYPPHMKQAAE